MSQRLYHRRCFRCHKCSGHLNTNNFKNFVGTEFVCDSCKNDRCMPKLLNNNDEQMGMLEFTDNLHQGSTEKVVANATPFNDTQRSRPQSILGKAILSKSTCLGFYYLNSVCKCYYMWFIFKFLRIKLVPYLNYVKTSFN